MRLGDHHFRNLSSSFCLQQAALTVGIWAAVMPAIMNPDNRIATEGDFGRIISANLFVFPWLGLLAALNALNAAMRTAFYRQTDDDVSHREEKSGKWFLTWGAFVATSLIVMMAASRQYEDMQCADEDNTMCDRLQYATWLGAIGGFLAFIWMLVDLCVKMQTALIEGILAVLLLVAWCFGVAYITFSDDAPAPTFSTLYFFSWASLLLACNLAASTLYQLMGRFIPGDEDSVEVEVEEVRIKEVEHSEEEEEDVRGPIAPEDQGTFVPGDQGTYARTDEEIGTTPTTPVYK